jgi:hypothetical protein
MIGRSCPIENTEAWRTLNKIVGMEFPYLWCWVRRTERQKMWLKSKILWWQLSASKIWNKNWKWLCRNASQYWNPETKIFRPLKLGKLSILETVMWLSASQRLINSDGTKSKNQTNPKSGWTFLEHSRVTKQLDSKRLTLTPRTVMEQSRDQLPAKHSHRKNKATMMVI